jgi:hypothetical protein
MSVCKCKAALLQMRIVSDGGTKYASSTANGGATAGGVHVVEIDGPVPPDSSCCARWRQKIMQWPEL